MDKRSPTYANFRILPTVPHHLSTVSIPHFTFRIPHSGGSAFYQQPFTGGFSYG